MIKLITRVISSINSALRISRACAVVAHAHERVVHSAPRARSRGALCTTRAHAWCTLHHAHARVAHSAPRARSRGALCTTRTNAWCTLHHAHARVVRSRGAEVTTAQAREMLNSPFIELVTRVIKLITRVISSINGALRIARACAVVAVS